MKLNEIKDNIGATKIAKELVGVLVQALVKLLVKVIKDKKLDLVCLSKVLKEVKCQFIGVCQKEDLQILIK